MNEVADMAVVLSLLTPHLTPKITRSDTIVAENERSIKTDIKCNHTPSTEVKHVQQS